MGGDVSQKSVVMYELNEVPWAVVDQFVKKRPHSTLAKLLVDGKTYTTINDDPAHLSPWRTWPTIHKSMYSADHNSFELGQDPATFRGTDLWDVLDAEGLRVGIFGLLQTWPPRQFISGGFSVPDTFARDASTEPAHLETFQRFNLKMTSENAYSSDAPLSAADLARTGFDLLRKGLTPDSTLRLARHLVQERRDARYKAARPMMQVLPSFDLYWRLHRAHSPRYSAFFTNHVAAMMHRYWGDAMPEYATEHGYTPDPVQGTFVEEAMQLADVQLRRIVKSLQPGTRLVVAASMGQGPISQTGDFSKLLVLDDGGRLASYLGVGEGNQQLAMHPMCSVAFETDVAAAAAAAGLHDVVDYRGEPLFGTIEQQGTTVVFRTRYTAVADDDPRTVHLRSDPSRISTYEAIGLDVRARLGGGNTAYHVPDGILIDYVPGIAGPGGDERRLVSALDVAPSLLANVFYVKPPGSMKGTVDASLFR